MWWNYCLANNRWMLLCKILKSCHVEVKNARPKIARDALSEDNLVFVIYSSLRKNITHCFYMSVSQEMSMKSCGG